MGLKEEIIGPDGKSGSILPDRIRQGLATALDKLRAQKIIDRAHRTGDRAPDFTLASHRGRLLSTAMLRNSGPLVISFQRGSWCPFCDLELRSLQSALPEIKQLHGRLLAVSPQLPKQSRTMVEKRGLDFEVLHDPGNRVAREFGLVFTLPLEMREIYPKFGMDVPAANGENSYELPVPATYVIDGGGTIVLDFVEINYTKRLAPAMILEALRGLA